MPSARAREWHRSIRPFLKESVKRYFLVISLMGSAMAGYVAAQLAGPQPRRAILGLAALILVLGLTSAIGQTFREPAPPPLTPEVLADPMARAGHAVQPVWYAFTLPVVGLLGVLVGGWRQRSGSLKACA